MSHCLRGSRWDRAALPLLVLFLALATEGMAAGSNRARHVILMMGDGMSPACEQAGSRYLTGQDGRLAWHRFPQQGPMATWSVTSYNRYAFAAGLPPYHRDTFDPAVGYDPTLGGRLPYPEETTPSPAYFLVRLLSGAADRKPPACPATDSAAAASAWATGWKTDDGNVSWKPGDPEDGALPTLAERMRARHGAAIGFVTTVPFNHASPAAFFSHQKRRVLYPEIAKEVLTRVQPDVIIGGGHPGWNTNYVPPGLLFDLREGRMPGYLLAERQEGCNGGESLARAADAATASGRKLIGLFGGAAGCWETPLPLDQPGLPAFERLSAEDPMLDEAAVAALRTLSRNTNGFFLFIEQGDIDWANHKHDYRHMIGGVRDLQAAVEAVAAYVDRPGDGLDWSNTLLIVTADHANGFLRFNPRQPPLGRGDLPSQMLQPARTAMGRPLLDEAGEPVVFGRYPGGEITYSADGHVNELVMVYARGHGLEHFAPWEGLWYPGTRILDNTHLHHIIARAAGLEPASPR